MIVKNISWLACSLIAKESQSKNSIKSRNIQLCLSSDEYNISDLLMTNDITRVDIMDNKILAPFFILLTFCINPIYSISLKSDMFFFLKCSIILLMTYDTLLSSDSFNCFKYSRFDSVVLNVFI